MTALDAYAVLDATTWGALALVLTVLGAALSWQAWRRRGAAAGLRGLAWTLVPLAAWLTGTLKLAASVLDDVARWAVHLVFSPVVWLGVAVAGLAAVLFVVSGFLRGRGGDRGGDRAPSRRLPRPSVGSSGTRRGDDIEGMDEIEAILKRHGI